MLMSATTNESVEQLQKLVLQNPVTLDLLEVSGSSQPAPSAVKGIADTIEHYSIHCSRYSATPLGNSVPAAACSTSNRELSAGRISCCMSWHC